MKGFVRTFFVGVAAVLGGYVIWDRVEVYRLNRVIDAIAAKGEPIDLSTLNQPLPSAQHLEAARLYAEAAARARETAQQNFNVSRLDVDAVVGSINVAELEETYRRDSPAMQLLDRATTLPFAGFGDEVEGPDWVNTSGLQALSALSALRSDLIAYRGDGDAAVSPLIAAIGVQRTLLDSFGRFNAGTRVFGSLRILLRHAAPSEASLAALQRAFEALPDEDGLVRELMLRRARLIESRDELVRVPAAVAFALHPFYTRTARVHIDQFPEVIAAARQPWPQKFAVMSTIAADSAPRASQNVVRGVLLGQTPNLAALSSTPQVAGLNLAIRRVTIATLAVERYRRAHKGQLPPALDALAPQYLAAVPTDPFTGAPIVFKAAGDSYLVYSFDTNRIDDGGAFYGTGSKNPMPAPRTRDYGIKVPLVPRPVAK